MTYGKFFASAFTGSMAGAGANVFAVWGYCLANGSGGQVDLNPLVVSTLIGCTRDEAVAAIAFLCAEDCQSRSKAHGGRRLTHLTGVVYEIVNYSSYNRLATQESVREYHREMKRAQRDLVIPPTCPGHVPDNGTNTNTNASSNPDPDARAPESGVRVARPEPHEKGAARRPALPPTGDFDAPGRPEMATQTENATTGQPGPFADCVEVATERPIDYDVVKLDAVKSSQSKRKRQLPEDFAPDATAIALAAKLGVVLSRELQQFRDHHSARGTTMLDWQAALRTWIRNARRFAPAVQRAVPKQPDARPRKVQDIP